MAVVTRAIHLMRKFGSIQPFESRLMASPTDMALLSLEQPLVVAGMGRMTSDTTVVTVTHQMIVRRSHLFTNLVMTVETGIDKDRGILSGMTILTAI